MLLQPLVDEWHKCNTLGCASLWNPRLVPFAAPIGSLSLWPLEWTLCHCPVETGRDETPHLPRTFSCIRRKSAEAPERRTARIRALTLPSGNPRKRSPENRGVAGSSPAPATEYVASSLAVCSAISRGIHLAVRECAPAAARLRPSTAHDCGPACSRGCHGELSIQWDAISVRA